MTAIAVCLSIDDIAAVPHQLAILSFEVQLDWRDLKTDPHLHVVRALIIVVIGFHPPAAQDDAHGRDAKNRTHDGNCLYKRSSSVRHLNLLDPRVVNKEGRRCHRRA